MVYRFQMREMVETAKDLTDDQWAVVDPLIIRQARRAEWKGRPRVPDRPINFILTYGVVVFNVQAIRYTQIRGTRPNKNSPGESHT